MTTQYYCAGCDSSFSSDEDPIPMASGSADYPDCPNSPMATYFAEFDLPESERTIPDCIMGLIDQSDRTHPVSLAASRDKGKTADPSATVPVPNPVPTAKVPPSTPPRGMPLPSGGVTGAKPFGKGPAPVTNSQTVTNVSNAPTISSVPPPSTGGWGNFTFKAPSAEEEKELKALRAVQEQADAKRRNASADTQEARQLIGRIERMIEGGGGGKSINFPLDLEYGTKKSGNQLTARRRIISLAAQIWGRKPNTTYRAPKWKKTWQQMQANFELDIVPGDRSKGKHNVHVVAT